MAPHKWIDQSQPQTLQGATIFCYLSAVLSLVDALIFGDTLFILILLPLGVFGYFIAQEQRWAYWMALVFSFLYVLVSLDILWIARSIQALFGLAFSCVLVALLLHPQTRAYRKVWFH